MKNLFLVFGLLSVSNFANALTSISAYEAKAYVGKSVTVCGTLIGVKSYKNNLFLNLEKPYPNQPFYFYIKNSDSQQLSKANSKVGKKVCSTGIVEVYKGRVEMQKNSVNELF